MSTSPPVGPDGVAGSAGACVVGGGVSSCIVVAGVSAGGAGVSVGSVAPESAQTTLAGQSQ